MYTYKEIKSSFPKEKEKIESLYGRIVPVRKLSYLFTVPLINMGFSAFQVSVISIFFAIAGCISLAIASKYFVIGGIVLIFLWHVFDCVDGNIARVKKSASKLGEFVDACSGYFVMAFLPFSIGIAAFNEGLFLGDKKYIYIIIGGVSAICELLMRLIHQKYAYTLAVIENKEGSHLEKGDNQYHLSGFHKLRKMIDVECGPLGLPMFVLFLAPFFKLFFLLDLYYCLFHIASLIVASVYYIGKGRN